jgi:hypothetical protein
LSLCPCIGAGERIVIVHVVLAATVGIVVHVVMATAMGIVAFAIRKATDVASIDVRVADLVQTDVRASSEGREPSESALLLISSEGSTRIPEPVR